MSPLSKREWFFIIAIAVGLILGKLIKRVTVGLALGLLLTFMVVMIVSNKKNIDELHTNQKSLEKFARETYLMKKDNEEVFVIVKK